MAGIPQMGSVASQTLLGRWLPVNWNAHLAAEPRGKEPPGPARRRGRVALVPLVDLGAWRCQLARAAAM